MKRIVFALFLTFSLEATAQLEFSLQYDYVNSSVLDISWGWTGNRTIEWTQVLSLRYGWSIADKVEIGPEYQFGSAPIHPNVGGIINGVESINTLRYHCIGAFGRYYFIKKLPYSAFISTGVGLIPSYPDLLGTYQKETSPAMNFKLGTGLMYSFEKYSYILSYDWGLITANTHPDVDEKQQGLIGVMIRRDF